MRFPQYLTFEGRKGMEKDGGNENENVLLDGRNHTNGDSTRLDT